MPPVDGQHRQEISVSRETQPAPDLSSVSVRREAGGIPRRRSLIVELAVLLLGLLSVGAGPGVFRSGHDHPLRLSAGQALALLEEKSGPSIAASSAILVDHPGGAVLWKKKADEVRAPASTTKMMTVLTAMESLKPEQVVTVPAAALVGGASMGLSAGDRVGVEALLHGALLPSGNDAAMTLALAAAGSEQSFVERMNANAAKWGLNETHFVNPHGLDASGHVSSARDLAELGRRLLAQPVLADIVRKSQERIEGYRLASTNELLTSYDGAYGVKTGTTDMAGQVLVAAAAREGGDALTVVMNSPDRYTETGRLLDFYFQHWQWVDEPLGTDVLSLVHAPDGAVYVAQTPSQPLFLSRWQVQNLRYFRKLSFDGQNQPSGALETWFGSEKLAETAMSFTLLHPAPLPTTIPALSQ